MSMSRYVHSSTRRADEHHGGTTMSLGGRDPKTSAKQASESSDAPSHRCLALRRDGHVYAFAYEPKHERAALEAFAMCPGSDPAEVLALVCYLGYDPRTLELGID
jgi:hypothetical protein